MTMAGGRALMFNNSPRRAVGRFELEKMRLKTINSEQLLNHKIKEIETKVYADSLKRSIINYGI